MLWHLGLVLDLGPLTVSTELYKHLDQSALLWYASIPEVCLSEAFIALHRPLYWWTIQTHGLPNATGTTE